MRDLQWLLNPLKWQIKLQKSPQNDLCQSFAGFEMEYCLKIFARAS